MNYVIFFLKATVKNRQNRYNLFIFYRWRNRLWEHKWLVQDHRDSNWESQILVYLSFFYWKARKSLKINAYWHIEKAEIQNWITLKDFLSFDLPIMYVLISTMPRIKGYSISRMSRNSWSRRSKEDILKVFHSPTKLGTEFSFTWIHSHFASSQFPVIYSTILILISTLLIELLLIPWEEKCII